MHYEMEIKLRDIKDMKETLTCWSKMEIAKGMDGCQAQELGEVIDMIKDLAEAEEKCWKACYYKTVVEAMEEAEDDDEDGLMGYNTRRYASGRYAPSGRGHMGYTSPKRVGNWPYMDSMEENMRMGYRDSTQPMMGADARYGKAYNDYQVAKRHYTETKSMSDKEEMDRHANEHVMDTLATVREMYKNADPDMKKRIKADFTKLVAEMPT